MKQFEFLDLVIPKVFTTWNEVVPPEKISLLKEKHSTLFDVPMLESQLSFTYNDKDFHQESSKEVLRYTFKFNLVCQKLSSCSKSMVFWLWQVLQLKDYFHA